jgi:1-deoxy-D-xylulose-5-phosphate synthase
VTVSRADQDRLLPGIGRPADARAVAVRDLPRLAAEIRRFLVTQVCRTGGHLGPNLGVVELTLALHRVFDSPHEPILFDTGHQAYVHKILTGRAAAFDGLRQAGGLSGYPSRRESPHDVIENSHASTALSYADGIARARALAGDHRPVVAVVGDGALTGGMCWEALNNIGGSDRPVVVVLNDNGRSYAPTVGGLASHLRQLRDGAGRPAAGGRGRPNIFTCLGFAYLGPVDGHDVPALESALRTARGMSRPVVVHCVTLKGKGYPLAEADAADCLHGVGQIDPDTGQPTGPAGPTWTSMFAEEIVAVGQRRPDVVCLTAAMLRPVGLAAFARRFPDRVFDVGIAEQHAVTAAAGLAHAGLHPVVAVYATFLNRAFDQLLMDVALHAAPVTFVLDRAGVTGDDGASHHGMWDLALLRLVPGIRVGAPRDGRSLRRLLNEAVDWRSGPSVVRFPKGTLPADLPALRRYGDVDILRSPGFAQVLLVGVGATAGACLHAARILDDQGVPATVVDPGWVAPVPGALLDLAARHRLVVTVEDGLRHAAGDAVAASLMDSGVATPVQTLGLPHQFIDQGRRTDILRAHGLDGPAIAQAVGKALAGTPHRWSAADLVEPATLHR